MDFISHFLWTYVLFNFVFHIEMNKGILYFFAIFPDLALIPFIWFEITHFRKYDIEKIHQKVPHYAEIGYHITHSYVTMLAVAFIALIAFPAAVLPILLGWGLMHTTVDLVIHKKGMQVMPFYPFSKFKVKGVVTWYKSTWFMVLDIILLVAIFTYLFVIGQLI